MQSFRDESPQIYEFLKRLDSLAAMARPVTSAVLFVVGGGGIGEAMASAVKAPEVTRTFEAVGSPVAYLDAPEFAKFVEADSARLIAAVKKIGKVE